MSKKALIGSLLVASILAGGYKWQPYLLNQKQSECSPIYIPRRHKFKKKNQGNKRKKGGR